jgi:hypothetical protein
MNRRAWEDEELELVFWSYEDTPAQELADLLGRSMATVYKMATFLGVRKSREWIAEQARLRTQELNHGGRAHRYPKGHVPANKGVKRPGFAPGRMSKTQFKKGQLGWNYKPIGATRTCGGYLLRKVSDVPHVPYMVNWKLEHVLRWCKKYGPVPAGHCLAFKDGSKANVRLANLELISRKELMARNTIHNLPEPLKEVIRLKGAINRVITRRRQRAEKQDERSAQPLVRNAGSA